MTTIGLLGKGGGEVKNISQHSLIINPQSTPRVQEAHITAVHILYDFIELGLNLEYFFLFIFEQYGTINCSFMNSTTKKLFLIEGR